MRPLGHGAILAGALALIMCGERRPVVTQRVVPAFAGADSLRDAGRSRDALARYQALRDSLGTSTDSVLRWRAVFGTGEMFFRLARWDSATAYLDQALRLAGGNPSLEARTRAIRAHMLSRRAQFDSSLAEARRAVRLAQAAGDPTGEGNAMHVIGEVESLSGRYRDAIAANQRQLQLRRDANAGPRAVANVLNQLGIDYRHVGRYTDAVSVYNEGLRLVRSTGIRSLMESTLLFNLANVRASTGDNEEALRLLLAALRNNEEINDQRALGFNHNGLGQMYLTIGDRDAARRHLERALAISREVRLPYNEVMPLINLGKLAMAGGDTADARANLARGLAIADSVHFGLQRASVRAALSQLAVTRGDGAEARRWAGEALQIADSIGDPEMQYEARRARAAALEAFAPDSAPDEYRSAIDLLESWRGRLALGDLRMGIAHPRWDVYEGAIRTLLAHDRVSEAFEVSERARARLLLELLAERERSQLPRSRVDSLRNLLREHYESRSGTRRDDFATALDKEIARLTLELEKEETRLLERDAAASARYPRPAPLAELRQGLVREGRGLLAFFWGDSSVYGWWIGPTGVRGARLGAADSLEALVDFLRGAIEQRDGPDWRPSARNAHARFVTPLRPDAVSEILVIADGPLAYLPLEVLIPGEGDAPLGATRELIYGPSASVLLGLTRATPASRWDRAVLAVGNPSIVEPLADGDDRGVVDTALAPLPYAEEEARAIREMFSDRGADVLLGPRATLERWLKQKPERYRYIHFAAHARVSDRRPERTQMVLADRPLDLSTIRRLRLRADLVTLSACETALGQRVRGEGVIGLPHAFLAAGARGTVVSLWRVSDRSTADFMRAFYTELRAGRSPATALRTVRRARVSSPEAHPSTWAPFILVGGIER